MLEVVLACASTGVLLGWAGLARKRRAAALRGLEAYGRARRLHVVAALPAEGRRAPRLEGTRGDVAFAIDVVRVDGLVCTRVVAKPPRAPCLVLRLAPTGGDLRLVAHDVAAARARLEPTRPALGVLALRPGAWVASDGAKVVCAWPDIEQEAQVLDAAIDVVAAVAAAHVPRVPYR